MRSRGKPRRGVIERLHPDHGELSVLVDGGLGIDHVPVLGDGRIVELEHEARVEDGLVLLSHRLRAGEMNSSSVW